MSGLDYAKSELQRAGLLDIDCEMQKAMNKHILEMVELFSKEGHSGFSASYALGILKKLLDQQPISPIEDKEDCWLDGMDGKILQHKHCSTVFKNIETGEAYTIEGYYFENQKGHTFTNGYTNKPVKFPYTPQQAQKIEIYEHL